METYTLHGGCHCGNFRIELSMTGAPATCSPRGCDCDFCRMHRASYISDPQGTLRIDVKEEADFGTYKQGSGLVDCLICRKCGVMIGATYQEAGRLYATINSKSIDGDVNFAAETAVSPKLLADAQKTERWKEKWFRDVTVHINRSAEL